MIGDEPDNANEHPNPSEEAVLQAEGGTGVPLLSPLRRDDILAHAYALARANAGAPGVDGMTFAAVEAMGLDERLAEIRKDLVAKTYRPAPVRRVMIPKPGGGERAEALAWTGRVMTKLGLALNETKTAIRDARRERFDFLGYSFGPYHYRKDGDWYLGASPSAKSVRRLNAKVGDILVPGNIGAWPDIGERLNRLLRGWSTYFCYGARPPAHRAVDNHVYDRVRHFLVRRHKAPPHGARRFPREAVFGALGVLHLRRVHLAPPPCASR